MEPSAARIFQRPRSATQSGRARTGEWVLAFERAEAKRHDPLTGWWGSGDTREQVMLSFPTCEAALAYAGREGLRATVTTPSASRLRLQAYSDNFR